MAPTTRRNFLILNYFVLVVHNVIFVLSLGVVGLSGNMLYWAAESNESNTTYTLDPKVLPANGAPSSSDIMEYPAGFKRLGTKLVLAAGIESVIATSISMVLIFVWTLRPVKHNLPNVKMPRHFSFIPILSLTTATLTLTTLAYSWSEHYNVPTLIFDNTTTKSSIYLLTTQTPESWLQTLSHSVLGASNQKSLHDLYVLAATGRVLLAPMLALQVITVLGLLTLRAHMPNLLPTNPSTTRSRPDMEKLRSSLLAEAYQRRASRPDLERGTTNPPRDPAADYVSMVRETADSTHVWRTSTLTGGANTHAYTPARLSEFSEPPTDDLCRDLEWVARLDGPTERGYTDEKVGLAVADDEEDIGDMYQRYRGWEALRDGDADSPERSWFDEPGYEEIRGRSRTRW